MSRFFHVKILEAVNGCTRYIFLWGDDVPWRQQSRVERLYQPTVTMLNTVSWRGVYAFSGIPVLLNAFYSRTIEERDEVNVGWALGMIPWNLWRVGSRFSVKYHFVILASFLMRETSEGSQAEDSS